MKLKRYLCAALSVLLLMTALAPGTPPAAAAGEISVVVDGKKLSFDQPPIARNGRTLVPLRAIFEALGADVEWVQESQSIVAQRGSTIIVMRLGLNQFVKGTDGDDGVICQLDVAPEALNGRTLVPLRAISEALDCQVEWDGATQTATIASRQWLKGDYTPTNACIHNGVVYYGFAFQPYVYAFDGSSTKTYAAGGAPYGIVVFGEYLYYLNNDNQTICRMDRDTGARTTVFSRLSTVDEFRICGRYMYIVGRDSSKGQYLYRLDLDSGSASVLYSRPRADVMIYEDGSDLFFWKDRIIVVESVTPIVKGEASTSCKVLSIDAQTGKQTQLLSSTGSVSRKLLTGGDSGVYVNTVRGAEGKCGEDAFCLKLKVCDTVSGKLSYTYDCYQLSQGESALRQISESAYEGARDEADKADGNGWVYGSDGSTVYRTNTRTGVYETLLSGSDYHYLTSDGSWVVVLQAKLVGGTPLSLKDYQYANVYVMQADGNGLRQINSYVNSAFNPVGEIDTEHLSDELCEVCGGRGRVICPYCRGSGNGQTITVLGMPTPQGCTYCGSSGERLCSGCGGSGRKQRARTAGIR